MTKLTFYGGVNEIGGNKILLEEKGTRILLDFGQSFDFGAKYFEGWLSPRTVNGLGDHFEFGLLPRISGLYSQNKLEGTSLQYCEPKISAVFLSHGHFDHVAHICFVDSKIPVHLGVGTKLFLESMEETSTTCDYKDHNYMTFRNGKKIKHDGIVVEPVHVDHSIPAAYGFIIRSGDSTIAYTGDLRLHGPRRDLTQEFIEKARDSKPDALICEGTRMALKEKRQNFSEAQVEQRSNRIVASTDKIVLVGRYSRDLDRFRSFFNVAKKNRRKIVVTPKSAYLLAKLTADEHLSLPDPLKDENIYVYYKRKKSGKIDIRPEAGGHFIRSMSEPFSEEDIEDDVLHNWLSHFGLRFHQLHASGHLNRDQIRTLVSEVAAKKVFPIHTENADLFNKTCKNVRITKKEKDYKI
jgi:ribonuclease J